MNPLLALVTAVVCTGPAIAQPLASLSGHVLSPDGRTLRAAVTLTFAGPRGFALALAPRLHRPHRRFLFL